MRTGIINLIYVLLFVQFTLTVQFGDFSLISTNLNQEKTQTKSFLQKKVDPINNSSLTGNNNNSTNLSNANMNSTYFLCQSIQKVMFNLIDLDTEILNLKESYVNKSKDYENKSQNVNATDNEKRENMEKQDNLVTNYVNKINEINGQLQMFKDKIMSLSVTKNCPDMTTEKIDLNISKTANSINSFISLISEEVKKQNLSVNLIAISNK